jgi:hypothetical protein
MTKRIIFLPLFLILAACSNAKHSYEVQSNYVPSSRYTHLSCEQLISEAEALRARTPALAAAVDEHRKNQDGVEVVTWVLFWPAAFMLDDGSDNAQQLAQAKGDLEAIQQNLLIKECG